jgi:hypothetical protein
MDCLAVLAVAIENIPTAKRAPRPLGPSKILEIPPVSAIGVSTIGKGQATAAGLSLCDLRTMPHWQRRTNVWRRVTSPAQGAKRPRSDEIRQPGLPVLAHAKRAGLIEAASAKVKARERK